jgi:predicted DNA-binding protein
VVEPDAVYASSDTVPAGDRIYSFRAPAELAERLAEARARFAEIAGRSDELDDWLARETAVALARRLRKAPEVGRDQSAFMREAVEILVGVTEKVAEGLELGPRYAAAEKEDPEKEAFGRTSLELMSEAARRGEHGPG